jgi:hypothetical protein
MSLFSSISRASARSGIPQNVTQNGIFKENRIEYGTE